MKIGFILPGKFHFQPIINYLAQHGHLHFLFISSSVRLNTWLVQQKNKKIKYYNSVLLEVLNRIPNRFGISIFRKKRELIYFILFDFVSQFFIPKDIVCLVGCSHTSLFSFRRAKKLGIKTVLDVSSAHVKEQNILVNNGYKSLGLNLNYYSKFLIARDLKEYDIADKILVPSDFVRNSMIKHGIDKEKIIKISYGVDMEFWKKINNKPISDESKPNFKLLFVGHLSVQKGIHILANAWKELKLAKPEVCMSLTLCGSIDENLQSTVDELCNANLDVFYLGKLTPSQLRECYSMHQALILPSLQDGYGMVLNEAYAMGLSVIASANTGITELPSNAKTINFGEPTIENIANAIHNVAIEASSLQSGYFQSLKEWEGYAEELVDTINLSVQ